MYQSTSPSSSLSFARTSSVDDTAVIALDLLDDVRDLACLAREPEGRVLEIV